MSNDYSSFFIKDEVKTWFKLGNEYDSITVGLKKELPAKIMFGAVLAQKNLKNLSKQKDTAKNQVAVNNVMKSLYKMAREYLSNVLDEANERFITESVLDQLGVQETIAHFSKIQTCQNKSVEENIKK